MSDHLNLRTLRAGVTLVLASIVPFLSRSPISEELWRPKIPLGLDLYLPVPEDNPLTKEKVELGRKLFFDPLLSRDQDALLCRLPRSRSGCRSRRGLLRILPRPGRIGSLIPSLRETKVRRSTPQVLGELPYRGDSDICVSLLVTPKRALRPG